MIHCIMKNTYRGRDGKLRFNNSGKLVHKWIARKKAIEASNTIVLPSWTKYIVALIFQLILIFGKVSSKEGVQIMLIQTILPLSPSTQPLSPLITILAIALELLPIYVIFTKLNKKFKWIQ